MEKDFIPNEKYSDEFLDSIQISYAFKDSCVEPLVEYRLCVSNNKWNFIPLFERFGPCRSIYDRWIVCQSNREFEISEKRRSSLKLIEEAGQQLGKA